MNIKTFCHVVICYSLITWGVSPELYAMPVSSSCTLTQAEQSQAEGIAAKLSRSRIHTDPDELYRRMGAQELRKYSVSDVTLYGGGYYGGRQTGQSSFFSNVESFLIELVEFFLFLAMLSYVVGYEEWLPWEKKDD